MSRRCNIQWVQSVSKGWLAPTGKWEHNGPSPLVLFRQNDVANLARDLMAAETELETLRQVRASEERKRARGLAVVVDGPFCERHRPQIQILLNAAMALANHEPDIMDVSNVRTWQNPSPMNQHADLSAPSSAVLPDVPAAVPRCRCGLTQGHEPTCPELDR